MEEKRFLINHKSGRADISYFIEMDSRVFLENGLYYTYIESVRDYFESYLEFEINRLEYVMGLEGEIELNEEAADFIREVNEMWDNYNINQDGDNSE